MGAGHGPRALLGEPVAVVMAESRALAEDALDLVRVTYRVLPPVVSIEAALADDAPILHPGVGASRGDDRHFRYGEPEAAFARGAAPGHADRALSAQHLHVIECARGDCRVPAR
ncbi:hypothetical protein ACTMU2_19880 [Cupriavidus basilensis]